MKRLLPVLFFCTTLAFDLSAQLVKGKIVDKGGAPVPNATVYIHETAQGIMADDLGVFQASLKEGSYTCEFSSLGYERKRLTVVVDKPSVAVTVELEQKVYKLREVIVSKKREDPAYAIMRKAISMAPFYLHQVKRYESEIYMKGSGKIEKIPALLRIAAGEESKKEMKEIVGKLFVVESQSEITFTAPNIYKENIVAFSTTIPTEMEASNPMDIMTVNIYDPKAFGRISPLSPGAFTYYTFVYEGTTTEGAHLVNKIRVQPKKKNGKLVTGWLYILEDSWNVYSADLKASEFGVTVHFKANYTEVKPAAFLPIAYDIDMDLSIMGLKAAGRYYASIQYKEVELNEEQTLVHKTEVPVQAAEKPAAGKPQTKKLLTEKQQKKQQKAQQQLEALADKEELSTREAYKMAKLMTEAVEPEEKKKERESLEIIKASSDIKVTVDSLAKSRDSLYWAEIRNLPLRPEEEESYRRKEPYKLKSDSGRVEVTVSTGGTGWLGETFMGGSRRLGKKCRLTYGGLLGAVPEYNFVDGLWLGQRLSLGIDLSKTKSLAIAPSVHYVTARKTVNSQLDVTYNYAPMRGGELTLSAGNTTGDYNRYGSDLRIVNSIASLFFATNPVKFYQKRFVEATNKVDLANGLKFVSFFLYEKRNALENRTSYSFSKREPSDNIPAGQLLPMRDNDALRAAVLLEYTPRYYYRVRNGRKIYDHSAYPTLSLQYGKGIPTGSRRSSNFDKIEAGVRQRVKLNLFSNLYYTVNVGKFISTKEIYFPDYRHFNANELYVTAHSLLNSFVLLDNYSYSTNKQWLDAHLTYTSDYLLLKHLPFLQSYLFNESLHAATLWIPGKNHLELGYSVGIQDAIRVGVFVGWEKGRYDAVGFTVSLPLLNAMGLK
ncbi:MAG: DUF5686 and carboxypeptidase regulatory-like domain-containing protein [Tannerellaceae bacterium]|jgi:hypothetical protein|nr:DUF5686 and carboxypeptidase regulatory-like domain-containing protein [Tannerellaceae bacterium]